MDGIDFIMHKENQYNTTQQINHTFAFTYDHNWRPTGTNFTMNGPSKQLNTLQDYELGQLKGRHLNGTATTYLQQPLYAYNARAWLDYGPRFYDAQ